MPRDDHRKNLSVHTEIYDKVKDRFESEGSNQSFTKWISEYLLMNLEKDEFLTQYAPFVSKIGIQGNVLTLKDSKKNKYVEIRMVNGRLQSDNDDPIYLQYALALPEIIALRQ